MTIVGFVLSWPQIPALTNRAWKLRPDRTTRRGVSHPTAPRTRPMTSPEQLLAGQTDGLKHPDGTTVRLTQFSTATFPAGMREQIAEEQQKSSQRLGEAIVHTLKQGGYTPVADAELETLRLKAAAMDEQGPPSVKVRCNMCQAPLVELVTLRPDDVRADPAVLAAAGEHRCQP